MLYEKIDGLIARIMKEPEAGTCIHIPTEIRKETLRAIKTAFTNASHSGITFPNDEEEKRILCELVAQRHKAAAEYAKVPGNAGLEASNKECMEAEFIESFLPEEMRTVPKETVIEEARCVVGSFIELKTIEDPGFNTKQLMRYTKNIISKVKEKYPNAEDRVIAGVVKEMAG